MRRAALGLAFAAALLAAGLLAGALVAAGPAPSGAAASSPSPAAAGECAPSRVPHLGAACLRPDGLWDVVLADGTRLQTHGPDPLVPADAEPGFADGSPERAPVCSDGARMEVLYGHPQGTSDRAAQVADDLRAAVRRMNNLLAEDAVASGGPPLDFKVACDEAWDIKVSSFTGPASGSPAYTAEYNAIVDAARAAGFKAQETDYLVFYDAGSTVCGVGNLYGDTSLSAGNANMEETGYGVVYDGCWFGRTPMHENGHTQGAVQDLAPMWDGSGHCIEGLDVMCYPGEQGVTGTATLGLVNQCSDRIHYDCGFDTYFDAAPEAGEWLASNWNIGAPVNRYLASNDTSLPRAGSPPPLPDPADGNGTANGTAASFPSSSSRSSSSSPSARPTPTSRPAPTTSRAPARVVADGADPPAAASGTDPAGPVTIEVPAAGWAAPLALAAAAGLLGRRRR